MTTLNQQEAAKASVALMGHAKVCIFMNAGMATTMLGNSSKLG
jgi:hypothetical protein